MIQYKDKLYIKDQTSKIREWSIFYDDTSYSSKYGVLNGEMINSKVIINEGKNIGKSNETTIAQQVLKEVESEYKDHKKKGYKSCKDLNLIEHALLPNSLYLELNELLSSSKTDASGNFKPMLANKKYTIDLPAFVQPKINGVRCTKHIKTVQDGLFGTSEQVMFLSREGIEYEIEHLSNIVKNIDSSINLDGELYISGEVVTSIGGAARNKNNILHKKLCYIIFDDANDLEQHERILNINSIDCENVIHLTIYDFCFMNETQLFEPKVYIIPTQLINDQDIISNFTDMCLQYGFEGSIVRDYHATYKFGQRTKYMRKYKKFDDAEFIILDIIPYEKDPYLSKFVCRNDINDEIFESIPIGNTEVRHEYLENKQNYIGKKVTIKFYERSITGVPFHSNVIGVRDYE